VLPSSIEFVDCYRNKLTRLPELPDSLQEIYCFGNPIYNDFLETDDIAMVKYRMSVLHKFKMTFYCIKYKKYLRKWLWDIREKKAIEKYNPRNLIKLLEQLEEEDKAPEEVDEILSHW
jgi:hypothetical protein